MAKQRKTTGSILELHDHAPLQALVSGLQLGSKGVRHQDRVIDCFDLLYVCQGVVPIEEDGREYLVKTAQTMLLWPHRRHRGTAEYSLDTRLYWLHFTLDETSNSTGNLVSVAQHADVMRPEILEGLFRRFLDDQKSGRLLPHMANLLLRTILSEIADQRSVESMNKGANGASDSLAERTLAYIHAYFHTALTVTQLSNDLGYNADYLNRIFRETYQRTLLEEIHRTRVDYARHLLSHTPQNFAQIAHNCGFADVNYLSRLFKRRYGLTPTAFRRLDQTAQNKLDKPDNSES